jgi:hypothetical protein
MDKEEYKKALEDFFNEEYKIESIKITDVDGNLKICIYIDIETYTDFYFEKCKFFNFKYDNKNLYDDISTGGDHFMDIKLSKLNDKWKEFVNELNI